MLKEMKLNPYNFGKCTWIVFEVVKKMSLDTTIKISSVKTRMCKYYEDKTICTSLNKLANDGYLKYEGFNHATEKTYIKFRQVKGEVLCGTN